VRELAALQGFITYDHKQFTYEFSSDTPFCTPTIWMWKNRSFPDYFDRSNLQTYFEICLIPLQRVFHGPPPPLIENTFPSREAPKLSFPYLSSQRPPSRKEFASIHRNVPSPQASYCSFR
jgi:hypothetical protein